MRQFFLDRVRMDPLLDGQNYIYMHYADMIANGYHRLAPCPFQTQGIMLNPNGDLFFCENSDVVGNVRDEDAAAIYFRAVEPGAPRLDQGREVPDVPQPLPDERVGREAGRAVREVPVPRVARETARSLAPSRGSGRLTASAIRDLFRSPLFRWLVTAAVLVYLATLIDMGDAAAAMLRVPAGVLLAVMTLVAIDRLVMVARWVLILKSSGVNISVTEAARIYLVSSFLGNFLLAGVGAEAMRAWSLGRRTNENSEAVASVAVDRLLGLLSIVMLGAVGAIAWTGGPDRAIEQTVIVVAVLVCIGSVAMLWADVVLRAIVPPRWLAGRAGGALLRLVDAVGRYRGRRGMMGLVLGLSIAVQCLRIAQAWLLGVGLGIAVPFRVPPSVHAHRAAGPAAAGFGRRIGGSAGRDRLAPASARRARRAIVRARDAHCPDGIRGQPSGDAVVLGVQAAAGGWGRGPVTASARWQNPVVRLKPDATCGFDSSTPQPRIRPRQRYAATAMAPNSRTSNPTTLRLWLQKYSHWNRRDTGSRSETGDM